MQLYTWQGNNIFRSDFTAALKELVIEHEDEIFVHSDTRPFGKIAASRVDVLGSLVSVLEDAIGPTGTLIMPTFTYSFCKGEPFDRAHSPSTVGALTEFFRTSPGVERSSHPLFSVAAWGKEREAYLRTTKDSFGEGTVFETLLRRNGLIVLLGTDFQSCTFLHFVEQSCTVPYRYLKSFSGTMVEEGREDEFTYFVRPLDGTIDNDFTVIEPKLSAAGVLRKAMIGGGRILAVRAQDLYTIARAEIARDPYFFVKTS